MAVEETDNKELRDFMIVTHKGLSKFLQDPLRNRRIVEKIVRDIESRTGLKTVELKSK